MENFVVSARKYRPSTFDSVVGQKAITNTLKNAIKTEHLAQAFLFCGSRGVGKTTCARILAKTINCFNRAENIEACNECDSCTSFNEGASLNIHELDAASNNSVDDIRNLIDQVRFAPQIGSHKVYIVDEVHMLSSAAFNAFLKTLEEPPAHAIFILATTEKHKIIPTILSRCQIFDFNRIEVEDIASHLQFIAQKEGITAEEEALQIVAQKADGALRDALSIFDQLVSFSGKNLTYEATIENLNILDYDYYFKSTDHILTGNIPSTLLLLNEIIHHGFDGHLFINGLASHFRNLLVCLNSETISLLEVGKNIKPRYQEQSTKCQLAFLIKALEICRDCDTQYRASKNKRLLVELSLMQLASINSPTLSQGEKKKPLIKSVEESEFELSPATASKPKPLKAAAVTTPEIKSHGLGLDPAPRRADYQKKQEVVSAHTRVEEEKPQAIEPKPKASFKNKFAKLSDQQTKTSSLSISELTKEEEKSEEDMASEAYTSEARESYTGEEFLLAWKQLAEKINDSNEEGSSMVYSAMITRDPIAKENCQFELSVDNKSQEEEMVLKRTDIHSFLRKRLKNGAIEVLFRIEKDQTQRKAYTDEEKFNKMAEENPHLMTLKKELGLDFI
ncbi:MAG: DNA polymerase III subunit gamma/tau [Flavobacteriales bacterium]|nr:DNA polymerase III subunit gamma/tau [Flavobacteriales bacterium]